MRFGGPVRQLAIKLALPALLLGLGLIALRLVTWPLWAGLPPVVRVGFAALILALLAAALIGAALAETGRRHRNLVAWTGLCASLGAVAILDRDYTVWQYQQVWGAAPVEGAALPRRGGSAAALSDGSIVLTRQLDGHYYISTEINGVTVDFLVDTGASGVALTLDDARRIGILLDRLDYSVTVSEASRTARAARVTIRTLDMHGHRFEHVPAYVMQGGERSLLGMSVLERFSSVEIRGDQLVLRP